MTVAACARASSTASPKSLSAAGMGIVHSDDAAAAAAPGAGLAEAAEAAVAQGWHGGSSTGPPSRARFFARFCAAREPPFAGSALRMLPVVPSLIVERRPEGADPGGHRRVSAAARDQAEFLWPIDSSSIDFCGQSIQSSRLLPEDLEAIS